MTTNSMDEHPYRCRVLPVPEGVERPLWSVMIPTYNCARYLRETLEGVLAQDPGPARMQIEVIDDHSTRDDPESVVRVCGGDRVQFFQQPQNVGHIRNFETCLQRSRGRWVHLLHGDDCVRPGFYERMQRGFEQEPAIGAAFCRPIYMDENGCVKEMAPLEQKESGLLEDGLERLSLEQRIMTPSIVVRREVYEAVGGFDRRLKCSEDWEMWVRIASRYPVWYETEPLAMYRMHFDSNTGRHIRSGEDISFTCTAINLFKPYLPPAMAARVVPSAKRTYAFAALEMARTTAAQGDFVSMRSQIRAALRCSRSRQVLGRAARLGIWAARSWLRRWMTGSP
jgi:hypothetical protein